MPISDEDDVNAGEAAHIVWLSIRRHYSQSRGRTGDRFERRIDKKLGQAADREDQKRRIAAEVEQAKRDADYAKKRDKAVNKALTKKSWW